jgi:hypothetical protein
MHKTTWILLWAVPVSLLCTGAANILAFWIFARLDSIGYPRHWWRMEDFGLYKVYWKLAPEHGWSRLPLVAAGAFFLVACVAGFWLISEI